MAQAAATGSLAKRAESQAAQPAINEECSPFSLQTPKTGRRRLLRSPLLIPQSPFFSRAGQEGVARLRGGETRARSLGEHQGGKWKELPLDSPGFLIRVLGQTSNLSQGTSKFPPTVQAPVPFIPFCRECPRTLHIKF